MKKALNHSSKVNAIAFNNIARSAIMALLVTFAGLRGAEGAATSLKAVGTQVEDRMITIGMKSYRVSTDTVVLRDPNSNVEFTAQRLRVVERAPSGQWEERPDKTTIRIAHSFYVGEGDYPLKTSIRDASREEISLLTPLFDRARTELLKHSAKLVPGKSTNSSTSVDLPTLPSNSISSDEQFPNAQELIDDYQSLVESTIARGSADYRSIFDEYQRGVIQRDAAVQQMVTAAQKEEFKLGEANRNLATAAGELAQTLLSKQQQDSFSSNVFPSTVVEMQISPDMRAYLIKKTRALKTSGQFIAAAQILASLANPWEADQPQPDVRAYVDEHGIMNGPVVIGNSLNPTGSPDQKYRMILAANLLQAAALEKPSKMILPSSARLLAAATMYLKSFELQTLAGDNTFAQKFLRNAERIIQFQTGVALGVTESAVSSIEGAVELLEKSGELTADLIRNPKGTLVVIKDASVTLVRMLPAALTNAVFNAAVTLATGDSVDQGRIVGKIAFEVATFYVGAGTARAAKAGEEIAEAAIQASRIGSGLGAKTSIGLKVYARIAEGIEALPPQFQLRFICEGTDAQKVAVIGRSMGDTERGLLGVRNVAEHLERKSGFKVATFELSEEAKKDFGQLVGKYRDTTGSPNALLPDHIVRETRAFAENKDWIRRMKSEGYTILDTGNPNRLAAESVFYNMEIEEIMGGMQ